ncbi:FKBP-type peptidyl-prolyl cis-trans isomerase [Spirosoma aerophilum]
MNYRRLSILSDSELLVSGRLKKCAFALILLTIFAVGCQQTDRPCTEPVVTIKAPETEVLALKQYIDSNHIAAKADDRGFFYTIDAPGAGVKPTACSNVTVNYTGKLTNGKTFDSASGISFGLNQLILGWQEGIPLVAPGGSITLYLPPSLAYGSQDQNEIPGNSILVFKIDLVKIN